MKNTLLLLFLLPLLSFGQSKKDLMARIYSMQLDSADQADLISDQQWTIAEAQAEIQKLTTIVNELNGDLSEALDAWSLFKQQLKLTKDSVVRLQREVEPYLKVKEALENPDTVTYLDLSGYDLSSLPPGIGQLTNLQTLYIGSNRLNTLPLEISKLQNLEVLSLGGNDFQSLPPVIGQLTKLRELDCHMGDISSLPPEIGKLKNLETLDLSWNNLQSLPPEIGKLSKLERLQLGDNYGLSSFPTEMENLTNLKQLELWEIDLTDELPLLLKLLPDCHISIDERW